MKKIASVTLIIVGAIVGVLGIFVWNSVVVTTVGVFFALMGALLLRG